MPVPLTHSLHPEHLAALLHELLTITEDAVVVVDASQSIVVFNEGAERMFGTGGHAMLGQPLSMLLPESARHDHAAKVLRFGAEGRSSRRMGDRPGVQGRRSDGSLFDAEASVARVVLPDQVYYVATVRDVSLRLATARELERSRAEAQAALRTQSLFLANVSHEIRTPLNGVIGMVALLQDTPLSGDQRAFANSARSCADALLDIVNDVLDFTKIESGHLELERSPFELQQLIEEAIDQVAPRAHAKRLNLVHWIEDGTPETMLGDATRLRQVVVNLLANAVKFTEAGEVVLTVEAERTSTEGWHLHLKVRDTGIGIAADDIARLFRPFTQVDAGTTRKYGGTGLGLAITRRLVELMNGHVHVVSEPARGSTFHAVVEMGHSGESAHLQRDDSGSELRGRKVLIVDDNTTNRRVLTRLTQRLGMVPTALATGAEALDAMRHGDRFDLALLDMAMPETDGLSLAREIRQTCPAIDLPLVLLTSMGEHPAPEIERELDLVACLFKPIKPAALRTTMISALHGRSGCAAPTPAQPLPQTPRRLRVLLAEDNPINQQVAQHLLSHMGCSVDVVGDGEQAVRACAEAEYDLVLMDVQMPRMDGEQAARIILQSSSRRPRIVALTADAMPDSRQRMLAMGMDGYLTKPIRVAELSAELALVPPSVEVLPDLLDVRRLSDFARFDTSGTSELAANLVDLFLVTSESSIQELLDAGLHHREEELRRCAHHLLSSALSLGADRLAHRLREVTVLARQANIDQIPASLAALRDEYDQTVRALKHWRSDVRGVT